MKRFFLIQWNKIRAVFDLYFEKRMQQQFSESRENIKFTTCTLAYLVFMGLMTHLAIPIPIKGILAQFEVLISIFLALNFARKGYFTGIGLNILNLVMVLFSVMYGGISNAVTGLVVIVFTIISISIIAALMNRNTRQYEEVVKQKEELLVLNREILASEEELRQQNNELQKSYQIIKSGEEKLNFLAYFDPLTELPNRKMILDRLELLVSLSRQNHSSFAVVFIDLDDFKKINDTMGHHMGDALIVSVASRLCCRLNKRDLLGRLGGDEFALIIQQDIKNEAILEYVDTLRQCLEEKFVIEGHELFIRASFGIARFPDDGLIPDELIRSADTAMYRVKETGKNGVYFFHREMLDAVLRKLEFEKKISQALQNGEFFLAFQPQFDIRDNSLRGFEALSRWQSPDLGLLSPYKFIPIAEETRLIIPLGQWILSTACRTFKNLMDRYHRDDLILSVNISAIQFDNVNFVSMLERTLNESGLPGKNLELEITESIMINSLDHTRQIINELKSMGVKIALDDFGTGYSSLRYLQLLPIDTLKIDKTFVDSIREPVGDVQLIGAIISLVHQLNIFVVAEGVETESQLVYLKEKGCDGVQGFLLGRPLVEPDLFAFLENQKVRLSMPVNQYLET